jgi:transcriptional regulator with XRE-family HTH domain
MFQLELLGQRIRQCREKKQWNQSEIADALGVSVQAVSKWERGVNAPDLSSLPSLAKLLDVSLDALLADEIEVDSNLEGSLLLNSLRGFAKTSSHLSPQDLAHKVNGIHHTSIECLLSAGGVPIKYTGDGCLGFVSGQNHTGKAFEVALKWFRLLKDPELVVVLWQGPIYVGLIGHHDYAQRDVLGKAVNEAFLLSSWVCDKGYRGLFCNTHFGDELGLKGREMKNLELSHGIELKSVWQYEIEV